MKIHHWIIIVLVAAIIAMIWFWPSSEPSDREKELDKENTTLLYKIDSLQRSNKARITQLKADSLRGVKVQDSLKTQANHFRGQAVKLKANPIIIRVREEVPEVDSLITAQDSVIVLQDHRIAAYTHQLGKLQVSMVGITANFESILSAERQRYANAQEIIALKDKEIKKAKKKTVGAVVIGVAATVGALLIR